MSNEISQPGFGDFWQWLDANAEELARTAGVSQPQDIKAALREIAKAAGADWNIMAQILGTLSGSRILPLFIKKPDGFAELSKIALRHTNAAFYALNAKALSDLMEKNPEKLKALFSDIIGSVSKSALPASVDSALLSLSNDNIAAIAVKKPALLIRSFSQITDTAGEFAPHIFSAISDENISALFAKDPKILVSSYSDVAKVSNREAAAVFILALKKPRLFAIFGKNPNKLVRSFTSIAKACGANSASVFYLLTKHKIAYMLEMDPKGLIESLGGFVKDAGKDAGAVIPFLFNERVEERFISDPAALGKSFNSLVKSAGKSAPKAIPLLRREGILNMFLDNHAKLVVTFSTIVKTAGKNSDAAFTLLTNPTICGMFEKDPGGMIQRISALSETAGDSAGILLGFLGREGIASLFEQDPEKLIRLFGMIGKSAGKDKKTVFAFFANEKFAEGFGSWPDQAMENLKKIADTAGPYAGDIFALLSKDRFAQTITELVSGEHLATCLVHLVNSSGTDAPMVLRLFESDEFTKRFINDPYREEQVVDHLRSFAGKDFAKGLEVLNDPEIAPVFAADPSVLVTTRFRAYVDNATSEGASASDAIEAILRDKKVKGAFIEYCRQEFEGGGHELLEAELLPAFRSYLEKKKR